MVHDINIAICPMSFSKLTVPKPASFPTFACCHLELKNDEILFYDSRNEISAEDIPDGTKAIIFGDRCKRPIDASILPETLMYIRFGRKFNHLIDLSDLLNLEHIEFGDYFDQVIDGIFPPGLKSVKFGYKFNQPIHRDTFPDNLTHIEFGQCFDQPIMPEFFPRYLECIKFGFCFNQTVDVSDLYALEYIEFGHDFDRLVDRCLPDSLICLSFGAEFNQHIDMTQLVNLIYIKFGWSFNQPIIGCFPSSLEHIEFGYCFDQEFNAVDLHNLRHVEFGDNFSHIIDAEFLPKSLEYIDFGNSFNHLVYLTSMHNLKYAVFGRGFNQPIDRIFPDSLEYVRFGNRFDQLVCIEHLPTNLLYMSISNKSMLEHLDSVGDSIYFSVIFDGVMTEMIGVVYSVLHADYSESCRYNVIGTEIINGKEYDRIITPDMYQPKTRAKSARK